MNWQITAKSGSRQGVSWIVSDRPVTLGRSLACDITIGDPTVSRRHCELVQEGVCLKFRDLGSRNVTLINGRIAQECYLEVGDVLSLGNDAFVVAHALAHGDGERTHQAHSDNTTISLNSFVLMQNEESSREGGTPPATAEEMIRLFQFSQQLQRVDSEHSFASLCIAAAQEIFPESTEVYLCLRRSDESVDTFPRGVNLPDRTRVHVERALRTGRSTLEFARKHAFRAARQLCISPLRTTAGAHAALVVCSTERCPLWSKGDLAGLDALASVAAHYHISLARHAREVDQIPIVSQDVPADFLGNSEKAKSLRAKIRVASQTRLNTLITGEAGTGKGLAAQMIHRGSPKPNGHYVRVDCEVVGGESFARALLGEERPTVSGGRVIDVGYLDQANGGTLVFREIGALTGENQKLLQRVLERRAFVRSEGEGEVSFHGRIIATSRTNLELAVRDGAFRSDLLKTLSRQRLQIAPLRHRRGDIRALAQYFVTSERKNTRQKPVALTDDALGYLEELPLWGNAVELRSAISKAVRRGDGEVIESQDFTPTEEDDQARSTALDPLEHAEQMLIAAVIRQCGGDIDKASKVLGISRVEVERITRMIPGIPSH